MKAKQSAEMNQTDVEFRERRITLKQNNCLTNDPCYYCGARCDPNGFDYFAEGTSYLVCDQCARKYSANIFEIRRGALEYAKWEVEQRTGYLKEKIRDAIKEPIENRILKALDEIGNDRLDPDIPF